MDIYQIWTTYNKKWSKYEILAFSVLLLLTVIVVAGCVCRKKINLIQAVAVVMMVIFLGIVFGSTVFTRTSTVRQYIAYYRSLLKLAIDTRDEQLLKATYSNLKELSGVTINERIEYCQYFFPYMVFPLRCIRKIKTAIDTLRETL